MIEDRHQQRPPRHWPRRLAFTSAIICQLWPITTALPPLWAISTTIRNWVNLHRRLTLITTYPPPCFESKKVSGTRKRCGWKRDCLSVKSRLRHWDTHVCVCVTYLVTFEHKLHCVREKSKPQTILHRNAKSQCILTNLRALNSEYIAKRTTKFS